MFSIHDSNDSVVAHMISKNLVTDDDNEIATCFAFVSNFNFFDNGNYYDYKITMDVEERSWCLQFEGKLYLGDNGSELLGDCIRHS